MSVYLHSQVFNRSNKSQHSQTIHPILKEKKKKEKQKGKEQRANEKEKTEWKRTNRKTPNK